LSAESTLELSGRAPYSDSIRLSAQRRHLLAAGLVAGDAIALVAAFAAAYVVRFKTDVPLLEDVPHTVAAYSWVVFWSVPIWLALMAANRLYDRRYILAGMEEYTRIANACTAGVVAIIVISFFDTTLFISRGWVAFVWVLSILCAGGFRFTVRRLLRQLRRRGMLASRALIVGANEEAKALAEQIRGDIGCGTQIVGFVDSASQPGTEVIDDLRVVGDLTALDALMRRQRVTDVIVATTALSRDDFLDLYRTVGRAEGIQLRLSSGLYEILTTGVTVQEVGGVPLITPQQVRITGVDAALKGILDFTASLLAVLLLGPAMLALALIVKLDSPGPALHRRRVLGVGGKPFDALKFRTMVVNADEVLARDSQLRAAFDQGFKLKRDPRVTRVGRFLRRTSLDELPQLLNVLMGDMSLVGPRMIIADEASRYGKWAMNLLTVKPGITGPWQVRGRSDITYPERVRLSMHYIRNYTIWLDLEILLRTVYVVLARKGAY
jgi:exopolysaccharide biosynthesis polyprenyl glycosylphosphotransferase